MTSRIALPVIVVLALALGACAGDPISSGETGSSTTSTTSVSTTPPEPSTLPPVTRGAELDDLAGAEARWAEAGLDTYAYTYRQSCECDDGAMGPNTVVVVDGAVLEVRMERQFQQGFDPNVVAPPGNTVPDLFEMIRASIERGEQTEVTYDTALGHPLVVRLDLESIPVDGGFDFELVAFDAQGEARSALAEARERWAANGPADYTFVYRPQCFCIMTAIEVTVAGGEIESHEVLEGELFGEVVSIDDIFAYVEESLDQFPASIEVHYDEALGYPTSVFVDFDEMIADEEFGYSVELTS